jgi:hypothetical protein
MRAQPKCTFTQEGGLFVELERGAVGLRVQFASDYKITAIRIQKSEPAISRKALTLTSRSVTSTVSTRKHYCFRTTKPTVDNPEQKPQVIPQVNRANRTLPTGLLRRVLLAN